MPKSEVTATIDHLDAVQREIRQLRAMADVLFLATVDKKGIAAEAIAQKPLCNYMEAMEASAARAEVHAEALEVERSRQYQAETAAA